MRQIFDIMFWVAGLCRIPFNSFLTQKNPEPVLITYFRQMYAASRNLSSAARLTLVVICGLPSLTLIPLVIHLSGLASIAVAKVEVFNFAKGLTPQQQLPELHRLVENLFTPDGLAPLVYTILATTFVGSLYMTFLLLPGLIAGIQKLSRFRR